MPTQFIFIGHENNPCVLLNPNKAMCPIVDMNRNIFTHCTKPDKMRRKVVCGMEMTWVFHAAV